MDFVILKVNGRDLSGATHEEAVEAFRAAKEPIIVQVVRQAAGAPSTATGDAGQPKAEAAWPLNIPPPPLKPLPRVPIGAAAPGCATKAPLQPAPPQAACLHGNSQQVPGKCPVNPAWLVQLPQSLLQDSQSRRLVTPPQQLQFLGQLPGFHPAGSPIAEAATPEADEFYNAVDDFDYEEVTLNRSSPGEKLGLTLCYSGSGSEEASADSGTDVFVSEVSPGSIAGSCGRLREGDQILRINGEPVRSRDQAVCLFSAAQRCVTLLIARAPAFPAAASASVSASASDSCLDDLHVEMMEMPADELLLLTEDLAEEPEGGVDEAEEELHQDSGVSSTQSSEQEVEELAAALTRLNQRRSPQGLLQKQPQPPQPAQQQPPPQQQQRWVPKMGTRLHHQQRPLQQPSAPAAITLPLPPPPPPQPQPPLAWHPVLQSLPPPLPPPQRRLAHLQTCSAACQTEGDEQRRQRAPLQTHQQQQQQWSAQLHQQQQQQTQTPQEAPAMEWVVKRRADGSRYVTRRPVRSRLLKARAAQLAAERAGLTTDDDMASCIGRWAPRHERKRHLRRQQQLGRSDAQPVSVTFV